jgi:glycine cleavage system regulatory protein
MTPLEIKLTDALRANAKLREQAEELIAAYIEPGSDRPAIINQLIHLFDGPDQREAERLGREALGEDPGNVA